MCISVTYPYIRASVFIHIHTFTDSKAASVLPFEGPLGFMTLGICRILRQVIPKVYVCHASPRQKVSAAGCCSFSFYRTVVPLLACVPSSCCGLLPLPLSCAPFQISETPEVGSVARPRPLVRTSPCEVAQAVVEVPRTLSVPSEAVRREHKSAIAQAGVRQWGTSDLCVCQNFSANARLWSVAASS